jgi:1-deoxy-D-xylulose-5-phosphate synthase
MGDLLDNIHSPSDLRKLSIPQLESLAQEIRERLIVTLSKTGGHLGPNLGVVELTLALHAVFETPKDKFVFDVSHQAYVHKMLTGRCDRFDTMRQPGGLNGFMLRTESEHDCYGAGHAGTALSAALGMAVARDLAGGTEHVIALAGDAAFTNGISYEALNNIADQTKRLIVVLNDNEWSIDRNVGAIAKYLHKIVTNQHVNQLHDTASRLVERIGGKSARHLVRRAEEAAKGMLWPSFLFEEFGLTYYGPVDGHNINQLIETFRFLKQQERPVILHALTQKGRGFQPALDKQKKFHGLGPYDPETGKTPATGQRTYSEIFAETLVLLANENEKIVAITAAMPNGTALGFVPAPSSEEVLRRRNRRGARRDLRIRYGDPGIQAVLRDLLDIFAAGIRSDRARRVFAESSGGVLHGPRGLSGDDGPTHHGLFDIAYLRGIPNIVQMAPTDEDELADMMYTAMLHEGPSAIRYPRGTGPGAKLKQHPQALEVGKADVIQDGDDFAILGLGALLPMAKELAKALERRDIRPR